jgi:hypothetical protein
VIVRSGSRVLDPRRASSWLVDDFGEDWVVPKSEVRYLITRRVDGALLFTAYGANGQLIGERLFADAAEGAALMERLAAEKLVELWRPIPDGLSSATRFLDSAPGSK